MFPAHDIVRSYFGQNEGDSLLATTMAAKLAWYRQMVDPSAVPQTTHQCRHR